MRDSYLVFGQPLIEQAEIDEVVGSMQAAWLGTGPKAASGGLDSAWAAKLKPAAMTKAAAEIISNVDFRVFISRLLILRLQPILDRLIIG